MFALKKSVGVRRPPQGASVFSYRLSVQRASAACLAILVRSPGVSFAALAVPRLACCGLTGAADSSDASPVEMATICRASWLTSRGRFGVERGLGMIES